MKKEQMMEIDVRNNINDLTNQEWLERSSSIKLTATQKEDFFKAHSYLHQLRKALMTKFGAEAVRMVFKDIVPDADSILKGGWCL